MSTHLYIVTGAYRHLKLKLYDHNSNNYNAWGVEDHSFNILNNEEYSKMKERQDKLRT